MKKFSLVGGLDPRGSRQSLARSPAAHSGGSLRSVASLLFVVMTSCTAGTKGPKSPPDRPALCSDAKATLEKLGGCGMNLDTWDADCAGANRAESSVCIPGRTCAGLPVGCIADSEDCDEVLACDN